MYPKGRKHDSAFRNFPPQTSVPGHFVVVLFNSEVHKHIDSFRLTVNWELLFINRAPRRGSGGGEPFINYQEGEGERMTIKQTQQNGRILASPVPNDSTGACAALISAETTGILDDFS